MKIGFLIRYFKVGAGGAENNCYYLAKELAKNKSNQVHIFCSGEKEEEEIIDNIKVHRSKEILSLTYYLAFYPSIINKLIKTNLDILHVHGIGFIQNDIAIRKLKNINSNTKIVCTPHGPFMALKSYNFFLKMIKKIYTAQVRKNLEGYDKIIQVNPFQKKWLSLEYGVPSKKIFFLPNGIPNEAFQQINPREKSEIYKRYKINPKRFIISYLGRIQSYKGLEQIIKILPELKKNDPKTCFLAMGKDAGEKHQLMNLAEKLNVRENVIFTGEVTEKEKFALLDISEIFVFPSEWEAFGIVVLEAMARKNAVISTKTEGGKYLINEGENGYLFEYQNTKELLKKIKIIINDNELRKKMQERNYLKAKSFLWSGIAKKLEKLYLELKQK